jgi:hypothetical protein
MGLNYNPTIVSDGLVMYFDPANSRSSVGSGNTIYDLTGNSNTCTFSATPTYDVASKGNILLAGSGTVAHTSTLWGSNQFTFSVWAKKIGTGSNGERGIMIAKDTNYIDHGYNNLTLASFKTSLSQPLIYGNAQASRNEWRHYATTYDGTLACLYENGALTGTTSFTGPLTSTSTPLYIGQFNGGDYDFNGKLGTIMTYNRALSAQEVKQNYDATKARYITSPNIVTSGLILNYDMSNYRSAPFSGTSIYDLSGFGNTGTLTNGPTYSGLNDGCLVFDGSNDYIDAGNNISNTYSALTIETVFKVGITNKKQALISTYNSGLGWGIEILDNTSSNKFNFFGFTSAGVYTSVQSSSSAALSQNYHITAVFSGSNSVSLYVNGVNNVSVATNYPTITKGVSDNLRIGDDPSAANALYFQGNIYATRLYNRALTQQEILQNYNATKGRFGL